ncbi:MAG: translation initiation factor IF-2 subunit alpha [Promethearchaeota archaeon]
MVRSRTKFPSEGEFVVARVREIQDQHVYVDLLDYEGLEHEETARGMVHISEISSRWVKNIRNYLREGQRVVLRVLRVDPVKGHVDLSYRRTNSAQRENRMKEWKYAIKYENLLHFLAREANMTLDEAYDMIGWPVLDMFNTYQEAIEELKENGEEILSKLKIPHEIKEKFLKIIDENISISTVSVKGKIKLTIRTGDGIEKIKSILLEAMKVIDNPKPTRNLKLIYLGAPFYKIEVISKDYLDAENILSEVLDTIESKVKQVDGVFEFIRD